jgi:glycine/D-amino acid oxidase-like deaminating enzyme
MTGIPQRAQVVVIGGGIVGCSVAYHLTLRGLTDVVLLERKQLTSGTTWHAAGLVGQLRATHNLTRLAQYTTELYASLAQESGQETGFRRVGSLALASDEARFEELKRGASMARCFGLEVNVLTPQQAYDLWPLMTTDDLVGAVHLPKDIWRDDVLVGRTTSGMFGHTVGKPLAMGYIVNAGGLADAPFVTGGRYEVEVAGERIAAEVSLKPFYDPTNRRVTDVANSLHPLAATS